MCWVYSLRAALEKLLADVYLRKFYISARSLIHSPDYLEKYTTHQNENSPYMRRETTRLVKKANPIQNWGGTGVVSTVVFTLGRRWTNPLCIFVMLVFMPTTRKQDRKLVSRSLILM
jgi:hypothetical protein